MLPASHGRTSFQLVLPLVTPRALSYTGQACGPHPGLRPASTMNLLSPVTPHIFIVEGEKKGRFPFSHSILIRDQVTALIDTGCGAERLRQIKREYAPDLVINSHTHPDHSAGNWLFEGTPLLVPQEGFDTSGQITKLSHRLTEPGRLAAQWTEYVRELMGFVGVLPTGAYENGHCFSFGDVELKAIYTPGHSIDHYCFFEPKDRILFSFDIDLDPFGPWYGTRESEITAFEESIRRVRSLLPRILVSSHLGIVTEDIDERLEAYVGVISQRDERILDFLSQQRTVKEIVEQALIYGGFPYAPELLRYWEGQMVLKHLERLVH
ncbi:MAG TPA: MBL fold metallo-hydrolase, partial [Anaerolineae bacterium]|nr:MBL fold metallo-hydrolase [Anaerolineae bacterium]